MRLKTRLLGLGLALLACTPVIARAAVTALRSAAVPSPTWAGTHPGWGGSPGSSLAMAPFHPAAAEAARADALDSPPVNDQCSGAITIPCGNISLSGDTFTATNNYTFQDTTKSCTTHTADGRDVVYKLSALAGDSLWVDYQSLADGSIYLVTDCSNVQDSCVAGADETLQGQVEHLRYGFKRAATYYLIVDNWGADTYGTWTLVGQFLSCGLTPPSNDRCDTATQLLCGTSTYSGSTQTAFNDYSFPTMGSSCAASLARGRDVVFKLVVGAGDSISASYTSSSNGVIYLVDDCSNMASCKIGVNATGNGGTETLRYRFLFTGTYYLILDSDALDSFGSWSLISTLVCLQAPANDVCATAITLGCGDIQLSGTTEFASDNYDLTPSGCTGDVTPGPDVVYRFDTPPVDSIAVDFNFLPSNPSDPQTAPDASIYIVKDCAKAESTCVVGRDLTLRGGTESLRYRFLSAGTYYLILDSYDANFGGEWTAVGNLVCGLSAVGDGPGGTSFRLGSSPNPFVRTSTIRFSLQAHERAVLRVYDIAGRVVRTLVDGDLEAGDHSATWNARDDSGARVGAGTYYARLMSGGRVALRKLILVR